MKTLYETIFDKEASLDDVKVHWYENERTEDTLSFVVDAQFGTPIIEAFVTPILKRSKKLMGQARNDAPDRMKNDKEPFVIVHEKPNDKYYLLYGFVDGSYREISMQCRLRNWFQALHCKYISTASLRALPGAYGTWEKWQEICLSGLGRHDNFYKISQKDFEAAYKFVLSKEQRTMKTLYETIFDPDFEPTVKNTSHKWQRHELKDSVTYSLLAKYGNPIVNKVIEPVVGKSRKTSSRAAQSKLEKGDCILVHQLDKDFNDYSILRADIDDEKHAPIISIYEFAIGSSDGCNTLATKTVWRGFYAEGVRILFNNPRCNFEYYIISLRDYNDIVALYNDIEKNSK